MYGISKVSFPFGSTKEKGREKVREGQVLFDAGYPSWQGVAVYNKSNFFFRRFSRIKCVHILSSVHFEKDRSTLGGLAISKSFCSAHTLVSVADEDEEVSSLSLLLFNLVSNEFLSLVTGRFYIAM